jgi:hypothetical protein
MNPSLLSFLLRTALGSSASLTPGQANPALWGSPAEFPIEEAKEAKKPDPQIDRIKQAFEALKDMHKGPDQTAAAFTTPPSSGPSPFDGAQWPYGPAGAPTQAHASALPTHAPMPAPRPAIPQDSPAAMGFFQRNAALQRDPLTGEYLDPASASKADAGVFKGLFA